MVEEADCRGEALGLASDEVVFGHRIESFIQLPQFILKVIRGS
jgi:hypothetical protein